MSAEIISTIERRRHWPNEQKQKIMSEALFPGASISAVADRHSVCRSQLYTWLRLAREGKLPGISMRAPVTATFVPVRISADAALPSSTPPCDPSAAAAATTHPPVSSPIRGRRPAIIEVVLTNGRIVRVDETIDPGAFARLVAVLDGVRL